MSSSSTADGEDDSPSDSTADLYACLGVSREATAAEIASAYRRLSRLVHPDKRTAAAAASGEASAAATDAAYQRVRRAYDVLRDPETRRVYDDFGLEGLRALADGAVALRGRGAAEIREELAKLKRLREEAAVMNLTQPATRLSVGLDVSSLFSPPDAAAAGEDNGGDSRRKPRGVYLVNLGFHQNTSFVVTPKHRLVLAGSLSKTDRRSVPSISLTLRSQLSDRLTSDVTCGLNYLPTAVGKLSYRLTPNLLASVRAEVTAMHGGSVLPTLTPSLSLQISPKCLGTLSCSLNSPTKGARAEVIWQLADGLHAKAAAYLSPRGGGAKISCSRQTGDVTLGASLSLTLDRLLMLRYSIAQRVSDYSEAAMSVKFGPAVGVQLKLSLSRGNQLYSLPIVLSDVVDPAAIAYGTATPVLAYVVLYKGLYCPWLLQFQRTSQSQATDAESASRAARRSEALAAQALMRETAANSRDAERARGGLVIDLAVYGCLATADAGAEADAEPDPAMSLNVTDCLQILVDASRLEIPAALTKADLPGFCDPGGSSQARHLLIKYTFNGGPHSVLLGDSEAVRLPQRKHAV